MDWWVFKRRLAAFILAVVAVLFITFVIAGVIATWGDGSEYIVMGFPVLVGVAWALDELS